MSIKVFARIIPGLVMLSSPCCKAISSQTQFLTQVALKADVFQKSASVADTAVKAGNLVKKDSRSHSLQKTSKGLTSDTQKAVKPQSATLISSKCDMSVEELNAAIERLLPKKNLDRNPLRNKADVFIQMGEKYEVNPVSLVAIAMCESARGVSSAALKKKNVGGLMGRKGLQTFKNVDDCIEQMAQILQRHTRNNRETISKLGNSGKYCAKSSAKNWIKHVNFYINQLEKKN